MLCTDHLGMGKYTFEPEDSSKGRSLVWFKRCGAFLFDQEDCACTFHANFWNISSVNLFLSRFEHFHSHLVFILPPSIYFSLQGPRFQQARAFQALSWDWCCHPRNGIEWGTEVPWKCLAAQGGSSLPCFYRRLRSPRPGFCFTQNRPSVESMFICMFWRL